MLVKDPERLSDERKLEGETCSVCLEQSALGMDWRLSSHLDDGKRVTVGLPWAGFRIGRPTPWENVLQYQEYLSGFGVTSHLHHLREVASSSYPTHGKNSTEKSRGTAPVAIPHLVTMILPSVMGLRKSH